MSDDKPLLEQFREQRTALLDEAAASIEQREKEREEFSAREKKMVDEIRVEVEKIQRNDAKEDEKRDAVKTADQPLIDARSSFAAAEAVFEADFKRRESEIETLNRRISEQEVLEFRKEIAAKASKGEGRISITNEEKTYRREVISKMGPSYFRDLAARSLPQLAGQIGVDPNEAEARLQRHAQEMDVEMPKRAAERERRASLQVDQAEKEFRGSFVGMDSRGSLEASPFERRVTPNRTDGQGGYFVPPLWLEISPLSR